MTKFWSAGDTVALRGMFRNRVWLAQAVSIVKDDAFETVLSLLPGAQCFYPEGLFRRAKGDHSLGLRWQEANRLDWTLQETYWKHNRFLIFLRPNNYYATFLVWHHQTNEFLGYYVNSQLPYVRSHVGFDSLDLDLDLVIKPNLEWHWKDEDHFNEAIADRGLLPHWITGVEKAKTEVLNQLAAIESPYNSEWLNWLPDAIEPVRLPLSYSRP